MPDALGDCVYKLWRVAPQPPLGLEARSKLLALGLDLKEEEKNISFFVWELGVCALLSFVPG